MDAISQEGVLGSFQSGQDNYTSRPGGHVDKVQLFPTGAHNHGVGRNCSSIHPFRSSPQKMDIETTNRAPFHGNGQLGQGDSGNDKEKKGLASHDQSFVHQKPEWESGQFYVRDLNSLWPSRTTNNETNAIRQARGYGVVEDGELEDTQGFGSCPNRGRIANLWPSLGKLCRIGTVGGTAGRSCRYILPNYWYKKDGSEGPMPHVSGGSGLIEPQGHRNNSPMVIDLIADESDRERVADFVHMKICKRSDFTNCMKEGSFLNDFMKEIQEYGFDHIIIIAEREDGILFLDCYGRVFDWDTSLYFLFPCGHSLEEASRTYRGKEAWVVEDDGTLVQIEYYIQPLHAERKKHPELQKHLEAQEYHQAQKAQKGKGKKKNKKYF